MDTLFTMVDVYAMLTPALALALFCADDTSGDIFSVLEEQEHVMVSVGSRRQEDALDATTSAWVIDRQNIERSGALTLFDLLRQIPGIAILDASPEQSFAEVRGGGHTGISSMLFVVDGVTVDSQVDTQSQGFGFAFPVALDDMERIEVALGPQSVLYGANAYIGVVSITTKQRKDEGFQLDAHVQGGAEFSSWGGDTKTAFTGAGPLGQFSVSTAQKIDKWDWRASVNGGYLGTPKQDSEPLPYQDARGDQPTQRLAGTLGGDYAGEHWALHFRGFVGANQENYFSTAYFDDDRKNGSASLQLEGHDLAGDDHLQLQIWEHVLSFRDVYQADPQVAAMSESELTAASTELFALYTLPTFVHNKLNLGVQLRLIHSDVSGTDNTIDPRLENHFIGGIFADDRFTPLRWLAIEGGLRFDDRESAFIRTFSRSQWLPRAAILLKPNDNHAIRFEYSSAVRNPTTSEGFTTDTIFNGQIVTDAPNYAIVDERHDALTLGYHGRSGGFEPRLEAFYGWRRDEIEATRPVFPVPGEFVNIDSEDYAGASAYLGYERGPWRAFAHYTYTHTWDKNPGANNATLLNGPEHVAGIGGTFARGRWEASVQAFYQSNTRNYDISAVYLTTANSLVINARGAVWIDEKKHWQLEIAGTNIGDIRFGGTVQRDIGSYLTVRVGPRYWLGLRYHFGSDAAKN